MRESDIQKLVQIKASQLGARLFRNNVGLFKTDDGRTVKTGLSNGSSDLIGFKPTVITQDMVGKKLAVFASIEIKSKHGRVSKEQQAWIDMVKNHGGLAGVVRTEKEAEDIFLLGC